MTTAARLLRDRADDDRAAFLFEDRVWSYRQLVEEGRQRGGLFTSLHRHGRPPHIGVLLDNGPEYLFWLAGAALCGAVVVGVNSTYRGEQLGQLIGHTDCELLVTSAVYEPMLDGAGDQVPSDRVLVVDRPEYTDLIADGAFVARGQWPQVPAPRRIAEEHRRGHCRKEEAEEQLEASSEHDPYLVM